MTQKMCDKAFDNYPSTIKYVPEYYKTHELFKAVHRCYFVFDSIPDQYKTREMCDFAVSLFPFLTVYCPNKQKTQRMYDEAVNHSLALELVPD